jgi:hypothetical protein
VSSTPTRAARGEGQPALAPPTHRATLFIIGHPSRGDDGAAEAALGRIARPVLETVDVVRAPDLDVEALMGAGRRRRRRHPWPEPGRIVVWSLARWPTAGRPTASTHGLPLPAVLKLAAALGGHPLEGRFVGIAGARFTIGSPLSAPVRAALPRAVRAIEDALREVVAPCA